MLSSFPRGALWKCCGGFRSVLRVGFYHFMVHVFRVGNRLSLFVTIFNVFAATSAPGVASYWLESKRPQFKRHLQQVYGPPDAFKCHFHRSRRHQVHKSKCKPPPCCSFSGDRANAADTLLWLNAYNRYLCMQMASYMWASNYLICMPRHGNSNVN